MTHAASAPADAAYVEGSVFRHVVALTALGSLGLMAIFTVDLVNLLYISLLGDEVLTAAMGYAGAVLFVLVSVGIGFSIGVTALTARRIGAGDRAAARRVATSGLIISFAATSAVTLAIAMVLDPCLALLGAAGREFEVTRHFLWITMLGMPPLALSMAMGGVLMAFGAPRMTLWINVSGAAATAILDPIFIFALDLGVTGAAIVTVLIRFVAIGVGWYGLVPRLNALARPTMDSVRHDIAPLLTIAFPAILTNLATPISNMIVTAYVARFGTEAVAGWSIIGRIYPLCFAGIFALTGSVGAIFGQNVGARRFDRVRKTLADSTLFTAIYVAAIWLLLFLGTDAINWAFQATGRVAEMIAFYCLWAAPTFIFTGALFVANAAFNNLGFASYSTMFNWGRATLGTLPFCWLGIWFGSADAVILWWSIGAALFGLPALWLAGRSIDRLAARA
ncbi:MATE family efflux transporter [Pleomorphomonas diazotrophica]|uniref:MATE family efflux transporter n=1 Tax=Pleomorphomonas diazotrophica TaxID=1166257 RepID=A0A1I4TTT9_9HYPH|nr:MATE family efflux transporter [Pleomorphomonas diazotrophica]PKR87672.1 MATE family efflux transporter [Pleomorphomonas diazotrophica]SFM80000.1 putative efflux protein, MATE family [Pleomorphomonas diazotrophica]